MDEYIFEILIFARQLQAKSTCDWDQSLKRSFNSKQDSMTQAIHQERAGQYNEARKDCQQ